MGDEAELDDADLHDVGVSGGDLPSFSSGGGGGLPSFSGGGSIFKPRASSAVPESPGGEGGGAPSKSPVEKLKKKKREDSEMEVDSPAADSSASGTPKPKKKKKSAAERKQSEQDVGTPTAGKSPLKGKEAGADKDKEEGVEEKKEGEGAEQKKEEEGEQPSDAEEDENDEDEDEKYKDAHRRLEQELIGTCSEEEWTRYEAMRQSKFSMQGIKLLVSQNSEIPVGQIPQPLAFTMSGVAKVLVGELIDNARLVRQERGDRDDEPLQPRHIQESYRRLMESGRIPECRVKKTLFRR